MSTTDVHQLRDVETWPSTNSFTGIAPIHMAITENTTALTSTRGFEVG